MGTLARQAMFNPPQPPRRLLFDFAQQNPLCNVLFVSPGSPFVPQDLSAPKPKPPWNPGLYQIDLNGTIRFPFTASTQPPFTPESQPRFVLKWRPELYDVYLNESLAAGTPPPFQPMLEPAPKPISRHGLLTAMEQDLQSTLFTTQVGNPYIPVDLAGRLDPPARNIGLYLQQSINIALLSGPQVMPPQHASPDYLIPPPRRIDYTITHNNIPLLSFDTEPEFPNSQDLPPKGPKWNVNLYTSYSTSLYVAFSSVQPPPSLSGNELPVRARFNIAAVLPQFHASALLAPPTFNLLIPTLVYNKNNGVQTYNAGASFTGATSYALSPAPDTGISINSLTGVISTDTVAAAVGPHGPYTVVATNSNGSTISNLFTIAVNSGTYNVDGPRVIKSTTALGTTYNVSGPNITRDKPESEDLS